MREYRDVVKAVKEFCNVYRLGICKGFLSYPLIKLIVASLRNNFY